MKVSAKSPGKVILSGEHAAVYGEPAVAASVDLFLDAEITPTSSSHPLSSPRKRGSSEDDFIQNIFTIFENRFNLSVDNLDVVLSGDLPTGSGLGSSAAAANATFQALLSHFHISLTDDELISLVQESEKFAHGHPSGLDAATVVKKGIIQFQRHTSSVIPAPTVIPAPVVIPAKAGIQSKQFTYQNLPSTLLNQTNFFLIQSGKPLESTKEMLEVAKTKYQTSVGKQAVSEIGKITQQLISDLNHNHFSSDWILPNEQQLEILGVVDPIAQEMINKIATIGGAAKITGAGGKTNGSGMLLSYHPDPEKMQDFLANSCHPRESGDPVKKWSYFEVRLGTI